MSYKVTPNSNFYYSSLCLLGVQGGLLSNFVHSAKDLASQEFSPALYGVPAVASKAQRGRPEISTAPALGRLQRSPVCLPGVPLGQWQSL